MVGPYGMSTFNFVQNHQNVFQQLHLYASPQQLFQILTNTWYGRSF